MVAPTRSWTTAYPALSRRQAGAPDLSRTSDQAELHKPFADFSENCAFHLVGRSRAKVRASRALHSLGLLPTTSSFFGSRSVVAILGRCGRAGIYDEADAGRVTSVAGFRWTR